jgi:hypothetical protein
MSLLMGRRSRTAPSRDTLLEIRDIVAVRTSGYRSGGLRIDWDKLNEADQLRTVELVREADKGTWSWSRLGKKKCAELERLIEHGCDAPRIFEDARAMQEIAKIAEEAHVASVRRPTTRKQETSLLSELGRCIDAGWLDASHVAIVVLVQIAFGTGRTLGPRSRIEALDDGDTVIVADTHFGLFSESLDAYAEIGPRWMKSVDHLAANEWLAVTKSGREWRISPGRRLKAAMAGRTVKDVIVA